MILLIDLLKVLCKVPQVMVDKAKRKRRRISKIRAVRAIIIQIICNRVN